MAVLCTRWLLTMLAGAVPVAAVDLTTSLAIEAQATDGEPVAYAWRTVERPAGSGEPEFLPSGIPGQVLVRLPEARPGRYGFAVALTAGDLVADGGITTVTVRAGGSSGLGAAPPPGAAGGDAGGGSGGGCGLGGSVALVVALALAGSRRRALP